jgi:hypothetical protein
MGRASGGRVNRTEYHRSAVSRSLAVDRAGTPRTVTRWRPAPRPELIAPAAAPWVGGRTGAPAPYGARRTPSTHSSMRSHQS